MCECKLVVPTIADVSEKIAQVKERIEYVNVEITPLINDLLGQLEEAAKEFVTRSVATVNHLVGDQEKIKNRVKAKYTELDFIEMYSESGVN